MTRFEELTEQIRYCKDGYRLLDLVAEIDPAFVNGKLTQGEAESLAKEAVTTSRVLISGVHNIPAEAFIGPEEND